MDQVFVDGLGSVTVINTTARLDFVVLSPTEKDARGQPQVVFCQRMVMGLDSFARMTEKMQEALKAMSKLAQNPPHETSTDNAAPPVPGATRPTSAVPLATHDAPTPARKPFP